MKIPLSVGKATKCSNVKIKKHDFLGGFATYGGCHPCFKLYLGHRWNY